MAEPYSYPLDRTQERTYPPDFGGRIYVWDIDKTYLRSEIDSIRGMVALAMEFAVDKRNVAGTGALLRALRRGTAGDGLSDMNPLYFVSASPPQLRGVLQRKMLLDGVQYDGITFKNQLAFIRRGSFSTLREQIGYKLSALLLNRRELPWDVEETLFGDDSESDALIYSLYSDILAGHLRGHPLKRALKHNGVKSRDADYVVGLAADLPKRALVGLIFINLETGRDPAEYEPYGPTLVPCHDTFQMALRLVEAGHLSVDRLVDVGRNLTEDYGANSPSLLRSAADIIARGHLGLETVAGLWPALHKAGVAPDFFTVDPSRADEHPPAPTTHDGALRTPLHLLGR